MLRVRDSETAKGAFIAALGTFDYESRRPSLEFGLWPADTVVPHRNAAVILGLTVVDAYDGNSNPKLRFNDVDYPYVASAVRMVKPLLGILDIHASDVRIVIEPDEQDSRASTMEVVTIDRQGTIDLNNEQYSVDPAELTASGLLVAFHISRHAQRVEDLGGAWQPHSPSD